LSEELKGLGLKGVSPASLKQCRSSYTAHGEIGQTLPDQSSGQSIVWRKIRQAVEIEHKKDANQGSV